MVRSNDHVALKPLCNSTLFLFFHVSQMLYLASIYRYIFSAIKIRLGNNKEQKKERKRKFLKVKRNCKNGDKMNDTFSSIL